MNDHRTEYTGKIERLTDGYKHHYVSVPDDFAEEMKSKGARRVVATINGHEVRRAINSRKDGRRFLILGQPLLKEIGVKLGDTVKVELRQDMQPDKVDMVEEFKAVLDTDEEAAERFYSFPPGKRRSLELYVSTAKSTDARIKRALELAEKIKTRTLASDRARES